MDILDILHKLVEHSTLGGAEKAELHGHVDALVEPEPVPEAAKG